MGLSVKEGLRRSGKLRPERATPSLKERKKQRLFERELAKIGSIGGFTNYPNRTESIRFGLIRFPDSQRTTGENAAERN